MTKDFDQWYSTHLDTNLKDFFDLLRFESIATDPSYESEVLKCAAWVHDYLKKIGLEVECWEQSDQPPILLGKDLQAGSDKETLLIYCHYDVQPVDPLDLWQTPPFEPTVRDGQVYARGACDNKGQLFYTLLAIRSYVELGKKFGFNLKFLIEGQEESGSTSLHQILDKKKEALQADHLLIVDSGFEQWDHPGISLGARGILCLGATLQEANFDLHSGMQGGIAHNPNRALVSLLAKLHDANSRVAIDGFYDGIETLDPETEKKLDFTFDQKRFENEYGFSPASDNPLRAAWLEPTLEINGIAGGYAGAGFKTVIPAKAEAKISCRLVAGQDPKRIAQLVTDFLKEHAPKQMKLTVEAIDAGSRGVCSSPDDKIIEVMQEAYNRVFQKKTSLFMIGGSIPIAQQLAETSGAKVALVGLGLGSDLIHAPNEHFGLDRCRMGFLTLVEAFNLL